MSNIKDRLLELIEKEEINPNQFYEKTGLANGYLDKVGNRMQMKSKKKISNAFPNWDIDYIENGIISDSIDNNDGIEKDWNNMIIRREYTVKDFFKDYYSYLNYSTLKDVYFDKQISELTDKEIEYIANKMDLDVEDLAMGIDVITKSNNVGKLVPVYDARAAAGNSTVEMSGTRNGWINIGDLLRDSEGSIYVYGNSMIPGYPPGSLLGVRVLNENFIEPGSVYVVETESNRYVKRLYYNNDKSALLCISDNHIKHTDGPLEGTYFYPPFEIPFSAVKCIYKVTGVIKRNSTISI